MKRFGALQSDDVRRLKQLEAENARLKKSERLDGELQWQGSATSACHWPGTPGQSSNHHSAAGRVAETAPSVSGDR